MTTQIVDLQEQIPAVATPQNVHRTVTVQRGGVQVEVCGGMSADDLIDHFFRHFGALTMQPYLASLPQEYREYDLTDIKASAENLR